ncbi:alanine dehydrogenase [Thermoanaerobacterium sp. RBIITD]|uniref:alanine dehydrogenase n=1 Tax=Thermoanaerobacterium sp. RBIITD TaxID=1550240 RepID=UPI000BB6AAC2|nr:alanine dehydrogenase [Thermoanaerobacterium sp. RBIITD]SNX53650.1 alanine dehydrogenase [Thermoanaerobacterium sp. RBIITD]
MKIGVPKEIKPDESRVAITPAGVHAFVSNGHDVFIEKNAGVGSGISDEEYLSAGAKILDTAKEVFDISDMIIKVKEPQPSEYDYFKKGQVLFTYLHLAPDRELTDALLKKEIIGIAYETVQKDDGSLPLLIPMSEVAGRMSVTIGAYLLENINEGLGVVLSGVPGVEPAEVVIVGGGTVGTNAAKAAVGIGAHVTILDVNASRLAYLDDIFSGRVTTLMSNPYNIAQYAKKADLLIGAVLIPGAKTPKLVTEDMVKNMKKGAVIVDVAIDQGGSVETIDRITTHENPYFVKYGVVHYSVANIPGAVPRTSTFALTNVTIPYALQIANKGYKKALLENKELLRGLNVYYGKVTYKAVADAHGIEYFDPSEVLT